MMQLGIMILDHSCMRAGMVPVLAAGAWAAVVLDGGCCQAQQADTIGSVVRLHPCWVCTAFPVRQQAAGQRAWCQ